MTTSYFQNIKLKQYLPLFFLLCFSGNPLFISGNYSKPLLVVYFILFIAFSVLIRLRVHKHTINYLMIFTGFISLLVLFRYFVLGFVSYPGVIAFIMTILLGLFTLLYYKRNEISFLDVYIRLIAFLAIISIPFWIINQLGFYGISIADIQKKSCFLYTFFPHSQTTTNMLIRNSGMFWEPGAFAGYLIVGLIFVIWQNKAFRIGRYRKEVLFIIMGILTAMSTTGYIVFSIILGLYSIKNFKWGKLIAVPVVIFIGYWGYYNLSFMQKKITRQYVAAEQLKVGDVSNTRFGTILTDWQYITARPFIGNGLNKITRYRFNPHLKTKGFGNGMSDFIADWGMLLFLWWGYCIYRFAKKRTESLFISLSSLMLMLLILQGEAFLNFPIFLMFFTIPFVPTDH